jgi:hypothetical protein
MKAKIAVVFEKRYCFWELLRGKEEDYAGFRDVQTEF